jgi:integrase
MRRSSAAVIGRLRSVLKSRRNGHVDPDELAEEVVSAMARAFPARIVRDGKVVAGKDGWLFLANDQNDVIAQMTGGLRLSRQELEAWRTTVEGRIENLDVPYLFMVAPDSHCIYPEKLPEGVVVVDERPVHQLIAHLGELTGVRTIYFADDLLRAKSERAVCVSVDSHWSEFGAFVAYRRIMEELTQWLPARCLGREDIFFYEERMTGDLGSKLVPARFVSQSISRLRYPSSRLLFDNCIENIGSVVVTQCREAPDVNCLLFGDSYAYPLLKFLSESFRRVVLAHTPVVDFDLIRRERPDVVLSLIAERHLVGIPDDRAHPSIGEDERAKRLERRTRLPRLEWSLPRRMSPYGVERLRAHLIGAGSRRDATIVSLLAYAGLRPREVLALRWSDVRPGELAVEGTRRGRRGIKPRLVRLLEPLAEDLEAWRLESGLDGPNRHIFSARDTGLRGHGAWRAWRDEVFAPAVEACGLDLESPHHLHVTFGLLLLYEGASAKEVARQLGHPLAWWKGTFQSLLADGDLFDPVSPEAQVRQARSNVELGLSAPRRTPLETSTSDLACLP